MREHRGPRFAIHTLERNPSSRGGDDNLPEWKRDARELMAGFRNELSESRARWAEENAARRERTTEFMAELRAEYGHGRPGEPRPDMEEVDCGYCGGRGSLPRTAKCPVCWGKGRVRIRAPYEKCDLCRGTGHVPGLALTCSKCKGKGWLHVERKPNVCPRCGGSGLEPVEETSLAALRERRRKGLPPPRGGIGRPLCPLCEGRYPQALHHDQGQEICRAGPASLSRRCGQGGVRLQERRARDQTVQDAQRGRRRKCR